MNEWDECPRFTGDANYLGPKLHHHRSKSGSVASSSEYDEVGVDDDSDGYDEVYETTKDGTSWDAGMRERERLMNEQDEKEKRAVNVSRTMVLLALCIVAFIVGHLIYFFVKKTELNDFSDMVRRNKVQV